MQIHEVTRAKLDEATAAGIGTAAGSAVSAVKNLGSRLASPFKDIKQGYRSGRQDQQIGMLADRLERAWQQYSTQWAKSQGGQYTARQGMMPVTLYPAWKQALTAFVQKNLLSGMQYSRLQNANQFDSLIDQLINSNSADPAAQKKIWNDLTLAASVAQHTPAAGAGQAAAPGQTTAGQPAAPAQVAAAGQTAAQLQQTVAQAIGQIAPAGTLSSVGKIIRQGFTNNNASVRSTGEPAVDALLMSLGFTVV
jgi:hypothetical protein